jgi:RNA polymerase sigma factor (sigma-70 family)
MAPADGTIAASAGRSDTGRQMRLAQESRTADDEDADSMLAYARGDARGFESLYARHKGATYRYFLRHVSGHRSTADELHQDLWLKVVGARSRYVADARFTTWLYTLARHRLVDHWRSAGTVGFASIDDEAVAAAVEESVTSSRPQDAEPLRATMSAQAGRRLVDALQGVPTAKRDAFLLHVEGGLSLAEIGALSGEPAETIKSRLRYAYRKLRAALEDLQ